MESVIIMEMIKILICRLFNNFSLFQILTVCHRRSGGHIHPGRFPKLDQNKFGVSRITGFNRCLCVISIWFAEFNPRWHLLFPIDRSLCRIDFDYVFGILSNDCHCMVLWHSSFIKEYQTNDRSTTVTVLSIVLASRWTISAVCKFFLD